MSAVIGVPHAKWGEAVTALVVLKPDASVTEQALIDYVTERKGVVCAPKSVSFETELPHTSLRQARQEDPAGPLLERAGPSGQLIDADNRPSGDPHAASFHHRRHPHAHGAAPNPGAAFADSPSRRNCWRSSLKGWSSSNRLDPGMVDDVITGCVSQVGEQSATPGRVAWLAAGFPEHVPSTTIDRKCGSSQQAIHFAAQGIMAGAYDIVIACGVESMSRVPMGTARMGQDPYGPSFAKRYAPGLVSQGVAAELMASRGALSREALDAYSAESHRRAQLAREQGAFRREILPIVTSRGVVEVDETIRPDTSPASLATLKPAFRTDELAARFPEVGWHITAGQFLADDGRCLGAAADERAHGIPARLQRAPASPASTSVAIARC